MHLPFRTALAALALLAPGLSAQEAAAVEGRKAAADADAVRAPLVYEPPPAAPDADLPGTGKHVVFVVGDQEYRSEESMPQMARILTFRHGFRCTVCLPTDPTGTLVRPDVTDNVPGLEALAGADLMVVFTRFLDLPDEQMEHVVDYVQSGRPVVGLRTATHAFNFKKHDTYKKWSWRNPEWRGGFGRNVLGETWIAHHGGHGRQATRGLPAPGAEEHPILRGVRTGSVWDPADVYAVRLPLPETCTPILLGQVLDGLEPTSPPARPFENDQGERVDKNDPMMPIAWTNTYRAPSGETARVFTTTMGTSEAFTVTETRRVFVNGCLWALGMDEAIEPDLDVALVGDDFRPLPFRFGGFRKGTKVADLVWPKQSSK